MKKLNGFGLKISPIKDIALNPFAKKKVTIDKDYKYGKHKSKKQALFSAIRKAKNEEEMDDYEEEALEETAERSRKNMDLSDL
jgi:hypothetical protein